MPNRISLCTSEPLRPGADIPVFYEVEAAGDNRVALYRDPDAAPPPETEPDRDTNPHVDASQDTEEECVTFEYAPGRAGVVWFSGLSTDPGEDDAISPGSYVLKLQQAAGTGHARAGGSDRAGEGVIDLAEPLPFELTSEPYFLVGSFTTANVLIGQPVCVPLAGLLRSFGRPVVFTGHSGDDWLSVSPAGEVTGVAPEGTAGRYGHLVVTAHDAEDPGARPATIAVRIPVRAGTDPVTDRLRVATWNMWYDATRVLNGEDKVLRVLLESGIDLVALQEVHRYQEPGTVRRLAERLGWYYHQYPRLNDDPVDDKDVGVLSRYPIDPDAGGFGQHYLRTAVVVGAVTVQVCTVHLDHTCYGPDKAPPGTRRFTPAVQAQEGASARAEEMEEHILAPLAPYTARADDQPVIILGDFNSPSHLDWTSEVLTPPVNWPATLLLEDAAFTDSYRAVHPDPSANPGLTWSPVTLWREELQRVEPLDRIDFIFHKGRRLRALDSHTLTAGAPAPAEDHPAWEDHPRYRYNAWPSDHAAVVTTYEIRRP
ncbi:endonuclease/exonuclease/phosphatase family protein [Streptomyces albus subsp. chlorinus]|uniref:endonuclease/exonuclease/phosphatase family protein n=1 Tax=Streptomyces albus TaxID=1888 RepID=UPI00156D9BC8|nr:endonuclease/exonuclease/phosphatase family protein [Streptomyces albus]NSC25120.1 endonuclease/exonuclease/phosphatase family protein [Streptomyces albus subsp. chlorinus]